MSSVREDLTILNKFNFQVKPVAVSFFTKQPEGLNRLETTIPFCLMVKRAQEGAPFYADEENHACEVGPYVLGGKEVPRQFTSGEYGVGHKHFKEARAMRRIYQIIPKMEKNIISCVAFSSIDALSFEPDLLIVVADFDQAQVLLRAMTYTTGKPYTSKFTGVMGCTWMYLYPYLTGELNYWPANLSAGMKLLKVFPEGMLVLSIPYDLLPTILKNLQDMPWVLPIHQGGEEFRLRLKRELGMIQ